MPPWLMACFRQSSSRNFPSRGAGQPQGSSDGAPANSAKEFWRKASPR